MYLLKNKTVPIWQFHNLSKFPNINHFVSGIDGGVSEGKKSSLNLGYHVGDEPNKVNQNRSLLSSALGVKLNHLIIPHQTHSNNVALVNDINSSFENTDALITNKNGICLAVMAADCVPILLYDFQNNVIAAIHSGWRGTVQKIIVKTVEIMVSNYQSNPVNIIASIGPSIGPESYEVGNDVLFEFEKNFGTDSEFILERNSDKGYLNLWGANEKMLLEVGVLQDNIEICGICTYLNDNLFFSARKSKNEGGRFAAGIMLK